MSHPISYLRDSSSATVWIIVGTFLATFVTLPLTIVQFFFILPSNIVKIYEIFAIDLTKFHIYDLTKFYYYDENITICYRKFFPGTIDYKVIVYFIHTINFIAVSLIVASFIVIAKVVIKSRRFKLHNAGGASSNEQEQRTRHRTQNFKIARMSVISTSCVLLPWLPSLVMSVLIELVGVLTINQTLGEDWTIFLLRLNQYLYYLVTWSFPLMAILTNPAVSRTNRALVSNLFNQNTTSIYINNAASPGPRIQKDVP